MRQSPRWRATSLRPLAPSGAADLVRVLPAKVEVGLDTWVTMHEDLRNSPRCKVTFDALVKGLTAYVS
jgi:hypothetical protein